MITNLLQHGVPLAITGTYLQTFYMRAYLAFTFLFIQLNTTIMAQSKKPAKAENDPQIFLQVRNFLKQLNAGNGKPIEKLSPKDARDVLSNAQSSVAFDYSNIEE